MRASAARASDEAEATANKAWRMIGLCGSVRAKARASDPEGAASGSGKAGSLTSRGMGGRPRSRPRRGATVSDGR